MHKRTIHQILSELLAAKGITPTEAARGAGVVQSTVQRILAKKIKSPKDDTVKPLADYLGVTTDQLRGYQPLTDLGGISPDSAGDPQHKPEANAVMLGPMDVWDDDTPLEDDEVYVPFLKEVELSAGSGRTSVQQSSRRKLRFGKITLRNQGVQPENAVCVSVAGNSMEPVLPHGSTVGVDRGCTSVTDGKTYAIDHDGELRVKTLYRLPGGGLRVRSFNREEHPDEEYSRADLAEKNISVIGKVFWSSVLW